MKVSNRVLRTLATTLLSALAAHQSGGATRSFPHPDRIRYDGQCLTIDGADTFIYSGAFHYFRCPKQLWADRFAKIKAAGFNTVETYIPWNRCEETAPAGLDDFSHLNLQDADDWMTMAESYGLNIIIRPGPYICAEWDRGGFPSWLLTKRPVDLPANKPWLRTDDSAFLAWSRHWYDAVCPMIAKHQITRKPAGQPGVILFQIENEYDYSGFANPMRLKHLAVLSDEAVAKGIDVPLTTCWTNCVRGAENASVARAFDSCNFYVGFDVNSAAPNLTKLRTEQPDAPMMVTELQGGWFTAPKDAMPIKPDIDVYRGDLIPSQIQNLELFAIQNGVTISNYYMVFGGTNLGFSDAGFDISTCYDYSAPIRECGGVDEKYARVRGIGEFLQANGSQLSRATNVPCDVTADQPDVMVGEREAKNGDRYFFVRSNQHNDPRHGIAHVTPHEAGAAPLGITYDLEPFGSKVLYLPKGESDASHGTWWPKLSTAIDRPSPTDLPAPVLIQNVAVRADKPASSLKPVDGKSAVKLGIGDRRLIYYQATASLPAGTSTDALTLVADVAPVDTVIASINGAEWVPMSKGRLNIATLAHAGENNIQLVYSNAGYANFDSSQTPAERMERLGGIIGVKLVRSAPSSADDGRITSWKMHLLDSAVTFAPVPAGFEPDALNSLPELQSGFDDSDWAADTGGNGKAEQLLEHQVAAFRAGVDLTAAELTAGRTTLEVARMDDGGWVYINGKLIGRGNRWDQSYSFNAADALKVGHNQITIVIRNQNGSGGLGIVRLVAPDRPVADLGSSLRYTDRSSGADENWHTASTDAAQWSTLPIPEPQSAANTAVEWRRLSFQLPAPHAKVWIPWLLRLQATGDGTISLNGHAIGRYYHATPQTDYYLPECWLNTGTGQNNVVTLQLLRAEKAIAVTSAQVVPYTAYAEKR